MKIILFLSIVVSKELTESKGLARSDQRIQSTWIYFYQGIKNMNEVVPFSI